MCSEVVPNAHAHEDDQNRDHPTANHRDLRNLLNRVCSLNKDVRQPLGWARSWNSVGLIRPTESDVPHREHDGQGQHDGDGWA